MVKTLTIPTSTSSNPASYDTTSRRTSRLRQTLRRVLLQARHPHTHTSPLAASSPPDKQKFASCSKPALVASSSPPPSVPNADFNKGMKLLPYDKEDELQKHFNGTKLIGDFNGTAPSSSGFDRCRQSMPCRTTFLFRTTSLAAALLTPDGGIHLGHCWPFRER
ncbi:hypothetical protein OCS_02799 [Ophiocordyceps sinensis CO18]|uniref:Uncharacterized protein n=1 Tax=Ophiocordyceps sinensis (strain Co18 / CGMCC 3.14243) TaxID=911162 RepID=T5AI22_OPHSC|nr:hypothetical protein OCS_02799 [Ophiocordyceps sinensis CO18]